MDSDCGEKGPHEKEDLELDSEMKGPGAGSKTMKDALLLGEVHHELVDAGLEDKPAPSGGSGGAWVEFEKDEGVRTKLEHLQKLLSEANRKLEGKDEEIKKLQGGLARYRKAYPNLDRTLSLKSKLKKEAGVTWTLMEELTDTICQVNDGIWRKEEEVSRLTRRINKLKLSSQGQGDPRLASIDQMEMGQEHNPVTQGRDAVSIFPEEVWRLILDNLTDPKDRCNCSSTCSLFRKILQEWKLPILLFQKVFPYLFEQLPQNRILELRLVSKGWGRVVDQFMEQQPSLQLQGNDSGLLPLLIPPMEQKKFHALNKFNFTGQNARFLDPENPGFPYVPDRNPFLGRVVTIIFNPMLVMPLDEDSVSEDYGWNWVVDDRMDKRPWENIYSFLRKFGKYIGELTIDSSDVEQFDYNYRPAVYHDKMFQFMTVDLASLVPHLRKLRILSSEDSDREYLHRRNYFQLNQIMPNLVCIEVAPSGLGRFVPALIRMHHSNLKTLHLTGNLLEEDVCLWSLDWPNLTELHLDHLSDPEQLRMLFSSEVDGCPRLGHLRMPRLRKLGINLRGMEKGLDWLLLAIHKLLPTTQLTTLRICGGIGSSKMFQRLWWSCCMSPTLTTLEVEHGRGEGFYDFLIHFPLVENVNVFSRAAPPPARPVRRYVKEGELDVNTDIQHGRMYESNIWESLPRLKLFTFKLDKFTRDGYEEFWEKVEADQSDSESLDANE